MSEWLDNETKAILQGIPPEKLAPVGTAGFTLVLLSKASDVKRLSRGLIKASCVERDSLPAILVADCPRVLATGLLLEDALLGQFELACCDSIAVFLRDEIVAANDAPYLAQIYSDLLASEEFQPVDIDIRSVPDDERGRRFLDQFLGADEEMPLPIRSPIHRAVVGKKARFMQHWGLKIGADVRADK